ncbi:MAG TPA: NAD-dependent epimerase/dehydratase family protein, partial [Casimicrobiaceae bacterium]|nr:NAD-dependent epimerase/dehydratase family protein [Casimicrobiaceae bacterium]
MRFLVLGGTRFLGRHLVDAAVERGHTVTTFTRGQSPTHEHPAVLPLGGDRDPRAGEGLAALASGTWDAAFDLSGYVPRIVDASCELLGARVRRYLFVSTQSVYADSATPGIGEDAAREKLADPASEDVAAHYGALKAACEDRVLARYGGNATIVRPGLIVGPHDPTDRFSYWVARFTQPRVLGERDDEAAVPAPPERPIQLIDARDLAEWTIRMVEAGTTGIFNAVGPGYELPMVELLHGVKASTTAGAKLHWASAEFLAEQNVQPWGDMPVWVPGSGETAGFGKRSFQRAAAAGLSWRPIA